MQWIGGVALAERALGSLEYNVLTAIINGGPDAHGAQIHDRLRTVIKRDISIGSIYTALERLERKGYVTSWWGQPTHERGGRRKRHYRLEAPGIAAIRQTDAIYAAGFGAALGTA
jgi:PadR family transcriptional regulator PadR